MPNPCPSNGIYPPRECSIEDPSPGEACGHNKGECPFCFYQSDPLQFLIRYTGSSSFSQKLKKKAPGFATGGNKK